MLDEAEIVLFVANGCLIMRQVFSGEELYALQRESARVIEEGRAQVNKPSHRYLKDDGGHEVYWRSEEMWQRSPVFSAAAVHPVLLENIWQCIGRPFYPWNDSLVVKLPELGRPVPWHQDPPYGYKSRTSTFEVPNFTTDIYLDASTTENGCVWAIPGHHVVGHVELDRLSQDELFAHPMAIPLEMEPGDVLFHCLSTPHGSAANRSGTMRRTLYLHYLAEEVFQDGYASEPWTVDKPGWTPATASRTEQMLQDRRELVWDAARSGTGEAVGKQGIEIPGITPTGGEKWLRALRNLGADEATTKKRLEFRTP